jgi:RNA polymerase sigma factor (TIGR02999 family)
MTEMGDITRLLDELAGANASASPEVLERLMPLVYEELRSLARSNRYRWQGTGHPGTTSLVHEAYLKMAQGAAVNYRSRGQFFAIASKAMRSILVDNARWHRSQKRGGGRRRVPLENVDLVSAERSDELLAVDEALKELEREAPDLVTIVVCRVFGGLTVEESAEALDVSTATVKRRWRLAKAWLFRELKGLASEASTP